MSASHSYDAYLEDLLLHKFSLKNNGYEKYECKDNKIQGFTGSIAFESCAKPNNHHPPFANIALAMADKCTFLQPIRERTTILTRTQSK